MQKTAQQDMLPLSFRQQCCPWPGTSLCFGRTRGWPGDVYIAVCSIRRVQLVGWQWCLRDPHRRDFPDPYCRRPIAREALERGRLKMIVTLAMYST